MTEIFLIRPGATLYDEQNRVQGILDIPLSDRGKQEVAALVAQLQQAELAALYHGTTACVQQTAETLGRALGLRPRRLDDLANLDQGLWQGLQVDEIKRRNPKVFRQWLDEPSTVCPPQGETVEEARDRARQALRPLLRRHRDEAIGLVVPDPIAHIIACYLRREPRLQLPETCATGEYERIAVAPDVLANGDP
jgi:broad specificity phosphatase PhoE